MTYKRAQELAQVVRKNEGVENENVRQALDRVEKQLATATENLPKLIEINKREEVEISKAVEIAKEIKKNTEEAQKALSEARESISENISEKEAVAVKISDISEKAKETHNQISEIIENYENIINNDEADKIDKNESATSTPPENDK